MPIQAAADNLKREIHNSADDSFLSLDTSPTKREAQGAEGGERNAETAGTRFASAKSKLKDKKDSEFARP